MVMLRIHSSFPIPVLVVVLLLLLLLLLQICEISGFSIAVHPPYSHRHYFPSAPFPNRDNIHYNNNFVVADKSIQNGIQRPTMVLRLSSSSSSSSSSFPLSQDEEIFRTMRAEDLESDVVVTIPSKNDKLPPHRQLPHQHSNVTTSENTMANEFARIINVDHILRTSAGRPRRQQQQQLHHAGGYDLTIEANSIECQALAKRFRWIGLTSLRAELQISMETTTTNDPEEFWKRQNTTPRYPNKLGQMPVRVTGKIIGTVTRRCVRTNEPFESTVEVNVKCIVQPVLVKKDNEENEENEEKEEGNDDNVELKLSSRHRQSSSSSSSLQQQHYRKKSIGRKRRHQPKTGARGKHIQEILEAMEEAKEMANANEIEDITIYNSANGNLDVGELVAQSFYLDLDDFPHKPGTKPVQISFIL